HVISSADLSVVPANMEAVRDWRQLTNVIEVHSFLALVGYYCRFVEGFLRIATPLTRLTQKKTVFVWDDSFEGSFQELKHHLTSTLILVLQEGNEGFVVYSDTSGNGLGCVLM
ncbi:hypothetical protein CFOL_v3_09591, partial [Cephalotus follicularis]